MKKQPRFNQLFKYTALTVGLFIAASLNAAPSNDNFANRIALNGYSASSTIRIDGATREMGEPQTVYGDHTAWWSYTAPATGYLSLSFTSNLTGNFGVKVIRGLTAFRATDFSVITTETAEGDAVDNPTFIKLLIDAGQTVWLQFTASEVDPSDPTVGPVTLTANLRSQFFTDEQALSNGVFYLAFSSGNFFGYYSYLADPRYIYHFDLGYEYWFDANDGQQGVYLYDFASGSFFYTSPVFGFPYIYDFSLNAVLYYYPDTNSFDRYTRKPRYFYNFKTGQIITK